MLSTLIPENHSVLYVSTILPDIRISFLCITDELPQESIRLRALCIGSHVQDLLCQSIDAAGLHRTVNGNVLAILVQDDVSAECIFHLILVRRKADQYGSEPVSATHGLINTILMGAVGIRTESQSADDFFAAFDHGIACPVGIVHDQCSVFLQMITVHTISQQLCSEVRTDTGLKADSRFSGNPDGKSMDP